MLRLRLRTNASHAHMAPAMHLPTYHIDRCQINCFFPSSIPHLRSRNHREQEYLYIYTICTRAMGGQMAINRMNQRTEAKHLHAICVQAEKSQVSFEV